MAISLPKEIASKPLREVQSQFTTDAKELSFLQDQSLSGGIHQPLSNFNVSLLLPRILAIG